MLTDEIEDKLVERLVRRIEKGNLKILKTIGQTIRKIKGLTPSKANQLVKMLRYGGDYKKIVKELQNVTKLNNDELDKILNEVAKSDYRFADEFYKYRNIKPLPYDKSPLKRQVDAFSEMLEGDLSNLTKTIAFRRTVDGKAVYDDIGKVYHDVLDEALLNITQGKSDFDTEMKRTLKELTDSGIRTVDYESGKSLRLDSAVRMNLKAGIKNLHNQMQEEIGKEIDADGIEILAHDYPAPDHAEVQGRQFKIEEFKKLQETGIGTDVKGNKYNLHRHLKDGKDSEFFRPISAYNCYHKIWYVVLGVQSPEYTDEQLEEMIKENKDGFEYDGKKYTMYEGTQLQRQMELEIRRLKEEQILARTSGNEQWANEVQGKINGATSAYIDFSKKAGLRTKMKRLDVDGYRQIKRVDNYKANDVVDLNTDVSRKVEEPKIEKIEVIDGKFYNSSKVFKASKDVLDLTENDNIKIYNGTDKLNITIYERKNLKKAYYSRREKAIHTSGYDENNLRPNVVLWHEMGHALDNHKGGNEYLSNTVEMRSAMYDFYQDNKTVPQRVKDYFVEYRTRAEKEYEEKNNYDDYYNNFIENRKKEGASEYSISVYEDWKNNDIEYYKNRVRSYYDYDKNNYYWEKKRTDMSYAQLGNFSDMFSAISKGEYNSDFCSKYGYHTKKYFNDYVENPGTELFANFVSLKMTGCKEHLEFFKEVAPDIYKELDKLYKEIGDDLSAK